MSLIKKFSKSLHYGKIFKYPRRVFKHFLSFIYPLIIKIWKIPDIKSIEDTIHNIKNAKCSIARFGDSEVLYIVDKLNLPYQHYDERLARILIEILKAELPNLIVGLPDGYRSINQFEKNIRIFWRSQISFAYPRFRKYLNMNKQYWNANITRLYYGYLDKSKSAENFRLIRSVWDKRDILLIEGEKSRLGMGNDLFHNSNSLIRILGPAHNAFSKFDDILKEALNYDKKNLILVAMGPTAKALVYELTKRGYQAIDIGNLDIEYEWFIRGVKDRIKIEGKYTSEVKGGRVVSEVNDEIYKDQIVKKIL